MYKVIAKQNYTDTRPELIENYKGKIKNVSYDKFGNAKIFKDDVYFINDKERAEKIKESGFATVEKIEEKKATRKKGVK